MPSRMKKLHLCLLRLDKGLPLFFLVPKLTVLIQAIIDPYKFTISFHLWTIRRVLTPSWHSFTDVIVFCSNQNSYWLSEITLLSVTTKEKADQFCYQFHWCRRGCFTVICFLFPFCISSVAFCVCFPSFILSFFCLYIILEIISICRLDLYSGVVDILLKYSFRGQSLYRSYLTEGATLLMGNRKGNSKAR
jgi:hypothetical protein